MAKFDISKLDPNNELDREIIRFLKSSDELLKEIKTFNNEMRNQLTVLEAEIIVAQAIN